MLVPDAHRRRERDARPRADERVDSSIDARAEREVARAAAPQRTRACRPSDRVADLSVGEAQRVEILKTLYRGAKILILDEPHGRAVAARDRRAVDGAAPHARRRRDDRPHHAQARRGDGDLRYDHRDAARQHGRSAAHRERRRRPRSRRRWSGRDVQLAMDYSPTSSAAASSGRSARPTTPLLEVRDLVVNNARRSTAVDGVSFGVAPGEILGIAGVEGNGQTELHRGDRRTARRRARLDRDRRRATSPRSRSSARGDAGLSHIPEDRHARGLVLDYIDRRKPHPRPAASLHARRAARQRAIAENARAQIAAFDIRPPDAERSPRARSPAATSRRSSSRARWDARFRCCSRAQPDARRRRRRDRVHSRAASRGARRRQGDSARLGRPRARFSRSSDRIAVMYGGKIVVVMPRAAASEASRSDRT